MMNMKSFSKFIFAFMFLLPNSLWAGKKARAIATGTAIGNQTGADISANSQANSGVDQAQYDSIQQSSVDNVNNGQKGQSVAYLMAGGLAVASARYYGMCGGWNLAACAAGAVLASMALSADKSGDSFNGPNAASWNNVCQYSTGGCGAMPNPYKAGVDTNKKNQSIADVKKINDAKGVSVDASSGIVKFPDGNSVNLNDPASMGAVLGAESTSKILAEVKNIEQQALKKVEQLQPSSLSAAYGLGGDMGTLAGVGYSEDPESTPGVLGATSRTRIPAQVTGLSKNFNGDPIGVAGDSLFGMMSRRYKLKSNQKTFFGSELNQ